MSEKRLEETSTIYQNRPVDIHNFPLQKGVHILHPERAMLIIYRNSIDLGALCYLRRSNARRTISNKGTYYGRQVDLNSFCGVRAEKVRKCITDLSEDFTRDGKCISTIYSKAINVIRFMNWADENNHSQALNDASTARAALSEYNNYLRERVNQNQIKQNGTAHLLSVVLGWLSDFMGRDDLHTGIYLVRVNRSGHEATMPPSEEVQSKALSLCKALFNGFAEFVLDQKLYPFRLQMPKYLGWEDDFLWVFPTLRWCLPQHLIAKRHELGNGFWAYNYTEGRVNTPEEFTEQYLLGMPKYLQKNRAGRATREAKRRISQGNDDPRHFSRVQAGMRAHNTFVLLFIAHTGLNWTQVIELPWDDKYSTEVTERQGFRTVKWRAGGRVVSIEIQPIFVAVFKRFLELRSYLLNGASYNRLFFTFGSNRCSPHPKLIGTNLLKSLWETLHIIDPTLTKVMSRQWRAGISDWYLRRKDPATTATALQNSETSVLKHYAAGSPTTAAEEMSAFYKQITEAAIKGIVLDKGQPIPLGRENTVGACKAFGVPHQLADHVPILPDCKSQEGCFFCDKYRVHADERDTRKLFSCRYCIQQTAHLPGAEAFFTPVLERIQAIIGEIAKREGNSVMVDQIRRKVEEDGELDPYWANKLELFINLELVTA